MAAHPEVLNYLIEGAKRRGINPDVVVKAFGHEGLNVFDPTRPDLGGDEGSSFGPFQLHYAGMSKSMPNAGMGDDFTRKTGLRANDPSTWKAQTDFVLDYLANGGSWSPWMGAKAEGITGRMGLPGGQQPGEASLAEYRAGTSGDKPVYVGGNPTPPAPTAAPMVADAMPAADDKPAWRKKLGEAIGGFKMPAVAQAASPAAQGSLAPIPAQVQQRAAMPNFDPNNIAQQRQQLAMAMQKLNTGKLWL